MQPTPTVRWRKNCRIALAAKKPSKIVNCRKIVSRMQTDLSQHYDPVTIALHWISVVLIGLLWLIAQTIDFAPSGALRVDYRSLHVVLGVLMVAVFIARFGWRMTRGRTLPSEGNAWLARIASLVRRVPYVLIAVALVLGLANVWVRGELRDCAA
jgi:cytochrome b561